MGNPFYNRGPSSSGGFGNMLQQFAQFRQNFQGDPRAKVQELLQSGQMSQAQFNDLYAKAEQIYNSGLFQNVKNGGNPLAGLFGRQ